MAWGALSLAIVSFLFIGLGVLFTPVPGVGAFFAFSAPLLALAGIIVGGRAVSRSKAPVVVPGPDGSAVAQPGAGSGLALAAVIASAIAFVPAVITALTCGACNALCATGQFQTHQRFNTSTGTVDPFDMLRQAQRMGELGPDAGVGEPPRDAGTGTGTGQPAPDQALPPPPVAPGPQP